MWIPVPFPPPPRGFAGLSALVPRASRILSCASSLSCTLNFHDANSCFLSGITISGCAAGPDDVTRESPESAAGRIGPAGACAAAPGGSTAHAPHRIAPTAAVRVQLHIPFLAASSILTTLIVLLVLALLYRLPANTDAKKSCRDATPTLPQRRTLLRRPRTRTLSLHLLQQSHELRTLISTQSNSRIGHVNQLLVRPPAVIHPWKRSHRPNRPVKLRLRSLQIRRQIKMRRRPRIHRIHPLRRKNEPTHPRRRDPLHRRQIKLRRHSISPRPFIRLYKRYPGAHLRPEKSLQRHIMAASVGHLQDRSRVASRTIRRWRKAGPRIVRHRLINASRRRRKKVVEQKIDHAHARTAGHVHLAIQPISIVAQQRIVRGRNLQDRIPLHILQRQNSTQMKRRRIRGQRHRRVTRFEFAPRHRQLYRYSASDSVLDSPRCAFTSRRARRHLRASRPRQSRRTHQQRRRYHKCLPPARFRLYLAAASHLSHLIECASIHHQKEALPFAAQNTQDRLQRGRTPIPRLARTRANRHTTAPRPFGPEARFYIF